MVLNIGSSWIFINVPRDDPCQISHCWVYTVAPFPRNGQNIALSWPKHDPHIVPLMGLSWILINVPKDVHCQISLCWVKPEVPFVRNCQNVALLWPKHGPLMVLQIRSSWFLINVPGDAPCQISQFWLYPMVLFSQKSPKYGPFMAKTWSSHGPSNWFFLNHNQCK